MSTKQTDQLRIEKIRGQGSSANYSLPVNQNSCENIFILIDGQSVMLQAVSIYTKPTEWTIEEMLPIMMDVSLTSLKIIGITE